MTGPRQLPRLLLLGSTAALAAGCFQGSPLDTKVDASSGLALAMAEAKLGDRLSPEQMTQFRDAVQEVKFEVMSERPKSGDFSADDAALRAIDGLTVREILRKGLYWKLGRLESEIAERMNSIKLNAQLRTRPDDVASEEYLQRLRAHQTALLIQDVDEVAALRKVLAALGIPDHPPAGSGATPGTASDPAAEDSPPVLIR